MWKCNEDVGSLRRAKKLHPHSSVSQSTSTRLGQRAMPLAPGERSPPVTIVRRAEALLEEEYPVTVGAILVIGSDLFAAELSDNVLFGTSEVSPRTRLNPIACMEVLGSTILDRTIANLE